jgi:transposase
MSLHPHAPSSIPEDTPRVARAAFARGNISMQVADRLGPIYHDAQFAALFPTRGQPAEAPACLALATLLQFAEGVSDRHTADAVRSRIDWKYVLGLALTDPGFDHPVLSEFRTRLVTGGAAHHSFLLTEHLSTLEYLDEAIERVSGEIDQRLIADQEAIALLDTIPGVGQRAAEILIAEIGTDMSRFPSAKHLASWAGMCPGNYESGGKCLSGKTRKGSRWVRQVLVEMAHVASKTKHTYLAAQYKRIAARRGKKRALIAVGHTILIIVYILLTRQQPYQDLGAAYFDQQEQHRVERRLVQRLERLGYAVSLQPRALAS